MSCPNTTDAACADACERVCFDQDAGGLFPFVDRCCSCDDVCDVSQWNRVIALIILLATLMLLAVRRFPCLPVGRALGAGCCAVLMVSAQVCGKPGAAVRGRMLHTIAVAGIGPRGQRSIGRWPAQLVAAGLAHRW